MSENEEKNDGKQDGETLGSELQGVEENSSETPESVKPSPSSPGSASILYGTRKRRPGAQAAPHAKTLDQIRGAYDDNDIIEMDDLPTRSSAPTSLVDESRPPERKRRERSERKEKSRESSDSELEEASEASEIEAYPDDEAPEEAQEESRPERFAEVDASKRAGSRPVQEFRPTKDGKRATPRKRAPEDKKVSKAPAAGPKKGLFARLVSLFSSESEEPEPQKKSRTDNRKPNPRRRRGGQNRGRASDSSSDRSGGGQGGRRPRRNRRPRAEGSENDGKRRSNRPRRRRRPQGERKQAPSE